MQEAQKTTLLTEAKKHITSIRQKINAAIIDRETKGQKMTQATVSLSRDDAAVQRTLVAHNLEQVENLKQLEPSPYFTRCDFVQAGEVKHIHVGKFSFGEEGIYSWITPAATLRFEAPGSASYTRPDGKVEVGELTRKDQYMITDGKLLFFSTESVGTPRELVYQEHFTRQKQGFILQEVVEQMEKAQDTVIRASHHGPFVISGPAGSGKTTLALHRVAYLMQSPETMEYFSSEKILVLVQDSGTKAYFSHLLPDLGIKGVSIVTFAEWAFAILGLEGYRYITDYGPYEPERSEYEYAKLNALRIENEELYAKNVYSVLQKVYSEGLTLEQIKIVQWQKKEKALDRLDVTVLLLAYQKKFGAFSMNKEYYEELANGKYRKRKGDLPVAYNLMIIDEFQNYLPEQLQILHACINPRLKSMVYVGDLAQQTQLGTIRDWESAGISVADERMVKLQKVYRNTKQILQYIQSLGYPVTVPEQLKSGEPVQEVVMNTVEEEIVFILSQIKDISGQSVGILARDKEYVGQFKSAFALLKEVHCLSYYEAQGVEFDFVFIVGIGAIARKQYDIAALQEEMDVVENDLLYVALTRAMGRLWVLGKKVLSL